MANFTVAAHQPNFFPWLGYFDKIFKVDVFIVLDDVQFPKTGAGTWSNRVPILVNGKKQWMTMPIDRSYHGVRDYRAMRLSDAEPWREKILRTLSYQYAKAPFFGSVFPLATSLVECRSDSLVEYNMTGICGIMDILGLPRERLVLASALKVDAASTERLVALSKAVGGGGYMCGGGADGYQEDAEFLRAGLKLIHQDFRHPEYRQHGATDGFVRGLSILDALFNIGPEATKELLTPLPGGKTPSPGKDAV